MGSYVRLVMLDFGKVFDLISRKITDVWFPLTYCKMGGNVSV